MAELISMRLLPLWVGARGIEFSWKYIQLSFEANISLVSYVYVYYVLHVQCSFVRLFVSDCACMYWVCLFCSLISKCHTDMTDCPLSTRLTTL